MDKVMLVAEIGCNHNGSVKLAREMVSEAYRCGVDAVKFQTFKASELISRMAPKAEYQKLTTGTSDTQLEMTKKLELAEADYAELRDYASGLGLTVFSTPFDMKAVDFLKREGQTVWKIPSGEITNLPYLKEIGDFAIENKWIILSTGMATIHEIKDAVGILQQNRKNRITILHCNTDYPTPDEDMNVSAILDLQKSFPDYEIGFSDHSTGSVAAVMAVAYGARLIEKHFTLDKNMAGPDHKASATPDELKKLVEDVRRAERMQGFYKKTVTPSEKRNMVVARKSIIAKKDIKAGEAFTEENLTCKRPGNGISPMHWYDVLGERAAKDFPEDSLIEAEGYQWQM